MKIKINPENSPSYIIDTKGNTEGEIETLNGYTVKWKILEGDSE